MKTYSDILGDGGSGVLEQVLEQRAAVSDRLSKCGQLLLIGSGKGGVGKSSLTVQLAFALKKKGYRVGILDADLNGPSIARMMGIRDGLFYPDADGVKVPETGDAIPVLSLGGVIPEAEHLEFQSVSIGDAFTWRATKEFTTLAELLSVSNWGELDFLLVDLPPGPERTAHFADFFGPRVQNILVSIPTALAHGVVARSISSLRSIDSSILGYIENMSGYLCPRCEELSPLFVNTERALSDCECLGVVPFDPAFAQAADRGIRLRDWEAFPSKEYVLKIADVILERLKGANDEISLRQM